MLRKDTDISAKALLRAARSPSQGSRVQASSGSTMRPDNAIQDARIDTDGRVRRLWQPGDPWTADFYFGGDDSAT